MKVSVQHLPGEEADAVLVLVLVRTALGALRTVLTCATLFPVDRPRARAHTGILPHARKSGCRFPPKAILSAAA